MEGAAPYPPIDAAGGGPHFPECEDNNHNHISNDVDDDVPSDTDAPEPTCPLCKLDEAEAQHAGASGGNSGFMKRIMAEELLNFGSKPDHVIYNKIAREYNRHIHRAMRQGGLQSERWTGIMVQEHFENHVQFIPRRIIGKSLKRLEKISKLLDREVSERNGAELSDNGELIDTKIVNKQCTVAKTVMYVLRDYQRYMREDMMQTGVKNLCKAIELGKTTASEAKEFLDKAALISPRLEAATGRVPVIFLVIKTLGKIHTKFFCKLY